MLHVSLWLRSAQVLWIASLLFLFISNCLLFLFSFLNSWLWMQLFCDFFPLRSGILLSGSINFGYWYSLLQSFCVCVKFACVILSYLTCLLSCGLWLGCLCWNLYELHGVSLPPLAVKCHFFVDVVLGCYVRIQSGWRRSNTWSGPTRSCTRR